MKTIKEIDSEIKALKELLQNVEGSKTEVYTRIVGYYRSVKNWNRGKKEEYAHRLPFKKPIIDKEILTDTENYEEASENGTSLNIKR
ncbi:MAG: hypothetical protein DRP87_17260 [Spirochaetes bacterium]|nr:MAG: hypothetical protein DRP87_17260 [Spirochaetota bacterium]